MQEAVARVRTEQRRRWQAGERVLLEELLSLEPALSGSAEGVLDLLYAEVLLREEFGDAPDEAEYAARFPVHAEELVKLFGIHGLFRDESTAGPDGSTVRTTMTFGRPDVPGYEIVRQIGHGAWGVVYEARQRSVGGRRVALKILRPDRLSDAGRATLRRDGEVAGRLSHPNVAQVYDCGECGACMYVAMELVSGGTLADRLTDGPIPAIEAARLCLQVALAVHHAHLAGIVHRDVKPSNVLMTPAGDVKVTDFGLAKVLDGSSSLASDGAIVGTWQYMAPEQAAGAGWQVGPSTDIWAIGVMLHEMLAGSPPFRQSAPFDPLFLSRADGPPKLSRRLAPRPLDAIRRICLRGEPAHRYPTARALADDVERFLTGRGILGRRQPRMPRLWQQFWRKQTALLAAALTAGGAATAIILSVNDKTPAERSNDINRPRLPMSAAAAPNVLDKFQTVPLGVHWPVTTDGVPGCDTKDGLLRISSVGISLFEVAKDPGGESYRYSVRMRHDNADQGSWIGVYFGYQDGIRNGSREQSCFTIGFSDRGKVKGPWAIGRIKPEVLIFTPTGGGFKIHTGPIGERLVPFKADPFPEQIVPWRKLVLDVRSDEVKVSLEEFDTPSRFMEFSSADLLAALRNSEKIARGGVPVGSDLNLRGGIGIYTSRGGLSVSSISLENLP